MPTTFEQERSELTKLSSDASPANEVASTGLWEASVDGRSESEQWLRSFFDNAPIGIYRTTPDGHVLMANPTLVQMLGYASHAELTSLNLDQQAFAPTYRRSEFKARLETEGQIKGLESSWTRRDGTVIFVRENARAIRGQDGTIIYYEGTIEDITDRKRSEAEQRVIFDIIEGLNTTDNLEELLGFVHESLKKVLYADNCFVMLYDKSTTLFRMQFFVDQRDPTPPPQKLGKSWTAYVFRTGRPLMLTEETFSQLVGRGEVEPFGTPPATWLGVPLRTPSEIIGVLVVQHYDDPDAYAAGDLEFLSSVGGQIAIAIERRRSEEALKQSEQDYRGLFENAHDAIFILDPEDVTVLEVNQSACELYGYSRSEFIGKSLVSFSKRIADERSHIAEMHGKGTSLNFETVHYRCDASEVFLDVNAVGIEYKGRRAVLNINRDISERKRAEKQARAFTAQLERSNRELQDFASVASHDLQEPLRKVQAFGDRLATKYGATLGDDGRDYLQRMQNAAGRMQILINDLLTFSRVTTQGKPFVPIDLAGVAREVASDLEIRIEQLGGRVELGELPTIDADPMQMRQLLQNLIGNGLKFSRPEAPPVVKVYSPQISGDDWAIVGTPAIVSSHQIIVEDNGIGFDEKYLDRIFTIFQRLHNRSDYEGTGIGLAVCRKIAERHGGSITARSTPGVGSTFIISLPVTQQKEIASHDS